MVESSSMWIKCLAEGQKVPGIDRNSNPQPFGPASRVQSNIPWYLDGDILSKKKSLYSLYFDLHDFDILYLFLCVLYDSEINTNKQTNKLYFHSLGSDVSDHFFWSEMIE